MQNYAAKKATSYLKSSIGLEIQLRVFAYKFPNRIHLEGALVPDYKGDTLFYIGSLDADFKAYGSFSESYSFNRLIGDSLFCYMTTYEDGNSMSKFVDIFETDEPADPNAVFNLLVDELELENSRYYLREKPDSGDLAFYWRNITGAMNGFFVSGSEVGGEIENLSFDDSSGFRVKSLKSSVIYGNRGIRARNLDLVTDKSFVEGDIDLVYFSPEDFLSFLDDVKLQGEIRSSSVHREDIQYFAPLYPNFPVARLSGRFKGPVNNLNLIDMELSAWNALKAEGDLNLRDVDLGSKLSFFTDGLAIQAKGSEIKDIVALFSDADLPLFIKGDDVFKWEGSYQGTLYDFNTFSRVESNLLAADLRMEVNHLDDFNAVNYIGNIQIDRCAVDQWSGNKDFGSLSAKVELNGKGLKPATMQSAVRAGLSSLTYKGYRYQGLFINGDIEEGVFDGSFKARDPNLRLKFDGKASFIADTSQYDFRLMVDSANLYAMNLVDDSLAQYKGFIDIDFRALNFDDWEGQISLRESRYKNARREHYIQDIEILSMKMDTAKQLVVASDIMEGRIYGKYTLAGLTNVFANTFKKFTAPNRYRDRDTLQQDFLYQLELKNTSLISQLLVPKLLVEPGTKISGAYHYRDDALDLALESKAIRFDEHLTTNLDLDFKSSYTSNTLNLELGNYLYRGGEIEVDSLRFQNQFIGDSLQYRLSLILRDSIDSYAGFRGRAVLTDTNAFLVSFDSSGFNLGEANFTLDPDSKMRIDSNGVSFDWFQLRGEELLANLSGYISKDPNRILVADIQSLNLERLNYVLSNKKIKARGYLNANIIAAELLGEPKFLSTLSIDTLEFNDVLLGQLSIDTDFDYAKETVYLGGSLKLGELETLDLDGYYETSESGEMDVKFNFNRFRLAALEPFASPIAENLRGLMNGELRLYGKVDKPDIDGELLLPKTALTVSFLQTDYNLVDNPRVLINNQRIAFSDLKLKDTKFGTDGILRGEVRHRNFQDFYIDLYFLAEELLVLNTTSDKGDAYYGTAYATGRIDIKGPPSKVSVLANVSSARKTSFNIPIGGATEVKNAGYVNFLPPPSQKDSISILNYNFHIDEGVSLDFDIDVNPNARVSIILNESTGNKLNANGEGLIKMKLEPNKELELFGTYTVSKGEYQFNLEGLFRKDFVVQQGGTVVWNGDPYQARLDLTAVYTTKANPGIITGESNGVVTPVEVYLYITGLLTNPEINFDIKVPRASTSTQSILSNRLNTEQAVNQQVFSLLAFNSFTPPSNFFAGAQSGINQWDIIANQAAAFLNKFTGDYRVSLSYQPASEIGTDASGGISNEEIEVGLSKNFFDERLTVNSSVEVPLNENNNGIAGDFELIYNLTEDGRIRAKAFNRSVDNRFSVNISQQQLYQQGMGLSFKTDFNTYSEVWRRILGKGRKEDPVGDPEVNKD